MRIVKLLLTNIRSHSLLFLFLMSDSQVLNNVRTRANTNLKNAKHAKNRLMEITVSSLLSSKSWLLCIFSIFALQSNRKDGKMLAASLSE